MFIVDVIDHVMYEVGIKFIFIWRRYVYVCNTVHVISAIMRTNGEIKNSVFSAQLISLTLYRLSNMAMVVTIMLSIQNNDQPYMPIVESACPLTLFGFAPVGLSAVATMTVSPVFIFCII